jgi:magnesium chelatase family protein
MDKIKMASCKSSSLTGLEGSLINVQAHITNSLPGWTIVGLPDTSLGESKARISSSFRSSKLFMPEGHITINLAPASLPKHGSSFDLAIATATLGAMKCLDHQKIKNVAFIGELGLDGKIHGVHGILPIVLAAKKLEIETIYVPLANEKEAKLVSAIEVKAVGHISEVVSSFGGKNHQIEYDYEPLKTTRQIPCMNSLRDFSEVLGQSKAKKALEIAAVGGHNLLMVGPPGTGKTMLASRFSSILPKLNLEQSLETSSVHSLCGILNQKQLVQIPPFEAPHHTATAPAIVGGGSGYARPGAISRAHNGVLFLDEAPEFSPRVLQTLRQPLENGSVTIDRAKGQVKYPAKFQLILAANPCPCGLASAKSDNCKCSAKTRRNYFSRLSGPLLDRIDLMVEVPNIKSKHYFDKEVESSAVIAKRVSDARELSKKRLKNTPWTLNSQVPGSWLRKHLGDQNDLLLQLSQAVDRGILSMRGADRALRVAFSIADLRAKDKPDMEEIAMALEYKAVFGSS